MNRRFTLKFVSTILIMSLQSWGMAASPQTVHPPTIPFATHSDSAATEPLGSAETIEAAQKSSSTIARIIQRGKLIVAIHKDDHSPFHMVDKEGNLIGADIEIAEIIAKLLGVTLEYNREGATFDDVVDIIASHQADITISKLSYTSVRAKKVRFSIPYATLHQTFIVSRLTLAKMGGSPRIAEIFANPKHALGVMPRTSYVTFAKEMFPSTLSLDLEANWDRIIEKLVSKELVGAFRDDNEIRKILLKNPNMNLSFITVVLKDKKDPICIAVPPDHEDFIYWLNGLIMHNPKVRFELDEVLKKYKDYL